MNVNDIIINSYGSNYLQYIYVQIPGIISIYVWGPAPRRGGRVFSLLLVEIPPVPFFLQLLVLSPA